MALVLTAEERTELERRLRSRKIRAEDARRAQVILMLADGDAFSAITATVGCYPDYINRWTQRFETERLPACGRSTAGNRRRCGPRRWKRGSCRRPASVRPTA